MDPSALMIPVQHNLQQYGSNDVNDVCSSMDPSALMIRSSLDLFVDNMVRSLDLFVDNMIRKHDSQQHRSNDVNDSRTTLFIICTIYPLHNMIYSSIDLMTLMIRSSFDLFARNHGSLQQHRVIH